MSLVPNVGEEYGGSIIVKIKEEHKDLGQKIRHRKYVTLENGLILMEDIMEDKVKLKDIKGDFIDLSYHEVDFPDDKELMATEEKKKKNRLSEEERRKKKAAKAAKKAEEDAKWEAELERRRQKEEEADKARKEKRLEEARKLKQQAEEAARKKAAEEEARKKAEEEAARKKEEEERKWKPQPITAYSDKDPDAPKNGTSATWATGGEEHEDEDCWKPQELWLYAPGKEPEDEEADLPKGAWGYAPGSSTSNRRDGWRPDDVVIYPPDVTPPPGFKPDGVYTYSPKALNREWPPPVDEVKKKKRDVARLPKEFRDMKPVKITAQPKSRGKKNSSSANAIWAYPKGEESDDKLWKPQDLWIYPPGEDPPKSTRPRGTWGYAPGSEPDPKTGRWDRKDILVFPPGKEPDNVKPQGTWEYTPDSENTVFPPPVREPKDDWKPRSAWVFPKAKCPRYDPKAVWKPQGIWKYHKNPLKDDKWRPQELWAYAKGQEPRTLDKSKPHGLWGLSPTAQPDENGNWKPEDMWFYAPGETPPADGYRPQGIWTYPPQKLKIKWPPQDGKYGHIRKEEELGFRPKGQPKKWAPQGHFVGRYKKLVGDNDSAKTPVSHPKGKEPLGVWKSKDDKERDNKDDWMSKKQIVYPPGEKPETTDDEKPHGVWGFSPDAEPDDDGEWHPSDVWFIPPDEAPPDDDEWIPAGVWTTETEDPKYKPKGQPDDWKPQEVKVGGKSGDDAAVGVWKFGSGDDSDDDDDEWKPSQVCMYPPDEEPENADDAKVRGVWGLAPGAEPDDDGEWKPSDVWFVAPDATPPEDMIPQGVWTSDEKKPPKFKPKGESDDWKPQNVSVGKKPDDDTNVGVWKFGSGDIDDDDDEWRPSQVCIYPPGEEPDDSDEVKTRGVWGLAPDAEPDDEGNFKPCDTWFFAPGETPPDDDEWTPHGVWTSEEEKPKKKKKKKKEKKEKKKPEKKAEEEPKKRRSYLPDNWKDQKAQYGQIITKTYTVDYSGDTTDLHKKTEDKTEVVELLTPTRRSQMEKVKMNANDLTTDL